ncbi:hypothetical protein ACLX1H_009071 [Fusarium chlamydosporum]
MDEMEQLDPKEQLNLDEETLPGFISECGSFLTINDKTVVFVHQSAKDFLLKESSELLFQSGLARHHYDIFQKSIKILKSLHKDMYRLLHPGISLTSAIRNCPEPDPLDGLVYAVVFWADHAREARQLSIQEVNPNTWQAISQPGVLALIEDALRFLLLLSPVIGEYPLQIYASGLLFSLHKSVIRNMFVQETPEFIARSPNVDLTWSPVLSVLETSPETMIRTMSFSTTN